MARLLLDVTPLRTVPAFRRLWLGATLSGVGSQLTTFAVTLQVFRTTGSSAAVGLLAVTTLVPTLVVGLLGGVVADSTDRRRLLLATGAAQTLVSLALVGQALAGGSLTAVFGLSVVSAVLSGLQVPAQRTVAPALLGAALLPSGLALTQTSFQLALVGGPSLAGLLTAAGGVRLCYLLDAATFLAALVAVWRLPALPPAGGAARRRPAAVLDGLRFARDRPAVGGALLSDLLATALAMPFSVLPALTAARFAGDPRVLGLLGSAPAVGGVLAMGLSGFVRHLERPGRALLVTGTVWGLGLAAAGVAPGLPLVLAALAVAGAADTLSVVLRTTVVQLSTPDRLRGRLSSLEYVVGVGGPQLGNARGGLVASLTSPATSLVTGGLAVVVALALLAGGCRPLSAALPRDPADT
ncbi:MFS transporter [Lapillicoccus jejuensis]|uniref:Putative MFS family arabinose efflux permease n=1 Tax=Lapillicoccus jejuensis TaxID=402171 RepID=A0A542DVX2_9MICO|nr:MFS transporter [Lapillicoccus jejuensis]TQJ07185.1 putative MFS family arabinose efflux permease [Lapillicoccus jejuensis]